MDEGQARKVVQDEVLQDHKISNFSSELLPQKVSRPLMMFAARRVTPVFDPRVRELCKCKYPKGCPNYGKRPNCPPNAPLFTDYFDTLHPLWALWVEFDLGAHVEKMRKSHPDWTYRQLSCCLYWQGTVRKHLTEYSRRWMWQAIGSSDYSRDLIEKQGIEYIDCPEATGVNVTATMKQAGVTLEWPPKKIVRKIYLLGVRVR